MTLNISEMFPLNGNLFDLPDVKLGLTLKASMLVETIEMYNPDDYPFEMIWIGKVEAIFYDLVEFANSLRSNEGLTEENKGDSMIVLRNQETSSRNITLISTEKHVL